MSEEPEDDIEHLRQVAKKAFWLANKRERELASNRLGPRGGEFFVVGRPYTVWMECDYYEDGSVVFRKVYGTVEAVDGSLVQFKGGDVVNTAARTFSRAVCGIVW